LSSFCNTGEFFGPSHQAWVHERAKGIETTSFGGKRMMHDTVFLFDVDNTLLDNDRVQADLHVHIGIEHGISARNRYWEIFENLRDELGYADYLGALERYRLEDMHDLRLLRISNWLADILSSTVCIRVQWMR
jgi:hypothetical protein